MKYPNLSEEKKLWKKGYKRVACLDESGRGPLAGPVIAAAVLINPKFKTLNSKQFQNSKFKYSKRFGIWDFGHLNLFMISDLGFRISRLRDSKKLSPKQREELYKLITKSPAIEWGIGRVSEKVIDRINILEATKLAMKRALEKLEEKPDFLILDGNFKINLNIPQKSIVKADEKVFSCVAASIIAKVTRDKIMRRYQKKYPQYGFEKHKGYPTKLHRRRLRRYGLCKIHRKTFKPVTNLKSQKSKVKNTPKKPKLLKKFN